AAARTAAAPKLQPLAKAPVRATDPAPRSLAFRVLRNGKEIESRPFLQNAIKIGRIKSSHLILDDGSVSRLHALVENAGTAIEIVDLGSASGTFVNGKKVRKSKLRHGDQIVIGTFQLELTIGPPVAAADS